MGRPTEAATAITVPFLDLQAQYREIEAEVIEAVRAVCAAQQFILGPRVRDLETRIAEYSRCRYGVGVSSGTDALLAALMALDIGPDTEVITTAYSFFATAGAIARVGARPVFCDIDPETYNVSPDAVRAFIADHCEFRGDRLINRRTGGWVKAMMPVHLFGLMADMDALTDIAGRYRLHVIEDAAQALGAEDSSGRRAGSVGAIGCFSFFPTKNLGAYGDAGMCVTNDPLLAERLQILRVHGSRPKYHHAVIGGNFRLDELQAAILLVKFKYLDGWTAARQGHADYYSAALNAPGGPPVRTPRVPSGNRHIFNQYVIRAEDRDALRRYLTHVGIGTEVYYPVPLHQQLCFRYLGYRVEDCPEAARAAAQTLALPVYPELTAEQRRHVVETLRSWRPGRA